MCGSKLFLLSGVQRKRNLNEKGKVEVRFEFVTFHYDIMISY